MAVAAAVIVVASVMGDPLFDALAKVRLRFVFVFVRFLVGFFPLSGQ